MRLDTWDTDMMKFIAARERVQSDCILFAVDCAHVMTGIDRTAKYQGYSGEDGNLRQFVTDDMGEEIPVKMARRGDWVLIEHGGREALAVCLGVVAVAAGPDRLIRRPMSDAIAAWRVE